MSFSHEMGVVQRSSNDGTVFRLGANKRWNAQPGKFRAVRLEAVTRKVGLERSATISNASRKFGQACARAAKRTEKDVVSCRLACNPVCWRNFMWLNLASSIPIMHNATHPNLCCHVTPFQGWLKCADRIGVNAQNQLLMSDKITRDLRR
jgi:hypothetical protein